MTSPGCRTLLGLFAFALACSGQAPDNGQAGGQTSTSGGAAQGGSLSSGGTLSSGGANTLGGAPTAQGGSSAGATASGGANTSGGAMAAGGAGTSGGATSGGGPNTTGGSAVAGGSSAGAAQGGGSAGPCGGAGVSFCTDFEAATLPSELSYYPEYQRTMMAQYITLDSTVRHGGKTSLKVDSNNNFISMLGVATPGPTFWGRVYLRSATDIQSGHNTYVAATDGNGDPNNGEQIRIGEHQCQLEVNRRTDDKEKLSNGGTYMCSGGTKLLANTWYCLEFFYDGPNSALRVFVDKTEITSLAVTDWGPYTYKMFKFGFEKYHGLDKTLWYDDLALGTERIPCQ